VVRTLHNRPGKETADSGFHRQKTRGNWEQRSQERKQQLVLQLHLHFSITNEKEAEFQRMAQFHKGMKGSIELDKKGK